MTHRCDICEKTFIQRSSLNTHMSKHTGEKTHICQMCDEAISLRS
jgi:KRAB domain-containing zinc finger protein